MKSRLLNMVWAGALSALLGVTGAPVWAASVTNPGGNSSVATAFNLDGSFSLEFEANIESGDGTNESTTIPHVTVNAVSEVGMTHVWDLRHRQCRDQWPGYLYHLIRHRWRHGPRRER